MNINCGCFGPCDQTLQVGDPDAKFVAPVVPIRIFGTHDGAPTVWLDKDGLDVLIRALQEAKGKCG